MHVVDLSFSKSSRCFTRMKDGDKDYKPMFPCYYVGNIDDVKKFA